MTALSILEAPDFRAGSWCSKPSIVPFYDFAPGAMRVLEILHKSGVIHPFDWGAWQSTAERLYRDPKELGCAQLPTLGKLLTLHVRKDRFCEGHLASMFKSGHITAILRRAAELRSTVGARHPQPMPSRIASILTSARIDRAIGDVTGSVKKYRWLQQHLHGRNVSTDHEYQRRFGGYYRVRRSAQWRDVYFTLLEATKEGNSGLEGALRYLYAETRRIEASFASKLIATIDTSQPVLDSVVLGKLSLRLPTGTATARIQRVVELHTQLARRYSEFLATDSGRSMVARFTAEHSEAHLTPVKMLDFVLWKS